MRLPAASARPFSYEDLKTAKTYGHAVAHTLLRLAMQHLRAVPSEIMIWHGFLAICARSSEHVYFSRTERANICSSEAMIPIIACLRIMGLCNLVVVRFSDRVYTSS